MPPSERSESLLFLSLPGVGGKAWRTRNPGDRVEHKEQDQPGWVHGGLLRPMSSGNRRSYRAAGRCLSIAILLILSDRVSAAESVPEPVSPTQAAEPQTQQTEPAPAPSPSPPIIEPTENEQSAPYDYQRPCENADSEGKADLCQQWRMAQGTEELARLTDRQNWITGIEAGILLATIGFTAIAALAAAIAAKASQKSIEQSERHANIQLRAYIFGTEFICTAGEISVAGDYGQTTEISRYSVSLPFKNFGSTPGNQLRTQISCAAHPMNVDEDIVFDRVAGGVAVCGPGAGGSTGVVMIPIEEAVACWKREIELIVYVRFEYFDVFSDKTLRETEYCVRLESVHDPRQPRPAGEDPCFNFTPFGPKNRCS